MTGFRFDALKKDKDRALRARLVNLRSVEKTVKDSHRPASFFDELRDAVRSAGAALLSLQRADGHWCFELEADCTISAEYILMMHFMDEVDEDLQQKIASYLRARQAWHDGWSLYPGGEFDLSGSVKSYFALKLSGDKPEEPHMVRARAAILAYGGAARSNVFTRFTLAMYAQIPWRAVPFLPVEIMLFPKWWWFHINKISYWSRTVMVPLAILCSLKAHAKNPKNIHIPELFTILPEKEKHYFRSRSFLNRVFLLAESVAAYCEPVIPTWIRKMALSRAEKWFIERLNGTDGLGAIFPAMVNAYEALALLGYPADHPLRITAKLAIEKLLIIKKESAYCQPCVSPVWDTALACLAMHEFSGRTLTQSVVRSLDWLRARQLLDTPGDWQTSRPNLPGGGWPFQFGNSHYPDIDDTAAVGWAMQQVYPERYQPSIERAAHWIVGMQSKNGGFAAFDVDNTNYYLNEIPFADHGALLDPPTSDVTGRCIAFLGLLDQTRYQAVLTRASAFLLKEQEGNGSWFGRWGTNFIYGTWSVLAALENAGVSPNDAYVQRALEWLKQTQKSDGGWGESNDTYVHPEGSGHAQESTSFQTAWAMLALLAAGETQSDAVANGARYLIRNQQADGLWNDAGFTAPGFPRVFYLKYHGYDKYFPLWALARYYNLLAKETTHGSGHHSSAPAGSPVPA